MTNAARFLVLEDALNQLHQDAGGEPPRIALLTRAMRSGDEAAYRDFYQAYGGRIHRYLLVVARGDEEAAREALQSTLVRVVRHIKAYESEDRFWNWLTVLARSSFLDQNRRRRRYFAFLDRFAAHAQTALHAERDGEADTRLFALLEKSVASLTPEERELVEQKYFQRRSVHEIAQAAQTTDKAVESRLTRVRQKLRLALLAQLKHESPE